MINGKTHIRIQPVYLNYIWQGNNQVGGLFQLDGPGLASRLRSSIFVLGNEFSEMYLSHLPYFRILIIILTPATSLLNPLQGGNNPLKRLGSPAAANRTRSKQDVTHGATAEAQEDTGGGKRSHCSQVERRLTLLVLHGGVGSVGQQQGAQLGPPLLRRFVERRERPLIGGVDARVVLDQQGGDVHVLVRTKKKRV